MTLRTTINRGIAAAEIAVIRAILERPPTSSEAGSLIDQIESLRAIDRCTCGCDSVDFAALDPTIPSSPVADGIGNTPSGGLVEVIV